MKELLSRLFLQVAAAIDGAALVRGALAHGESSWSSGERRHVLALGKVAGPMLRGLLAQGGVGGTGGGLVIAPGARLPAAWELPPGFTAMPSDHPVPSERSRAAGLAARAFVSALGPDDQLLVLLSGGGSALAAVPAGDLTLAEKRATIAAVARGGATIHELNTVRKHLSAVKGGQLALATPAATTVLALSDVVGNDPATIASGPFSGDPTTFAQALAVLARRAPGCVGPGRSWLEAGAAGHHPETPKPGDPRLGRVRYEILAGPERVPHEARRLAEEAGLRTGLLSRDTEADVEELAAAYADRARHEAAAGGGRRVLIGNGEPTIVVRQEGRGGRSTHLALLVARAIAGRDGVTFLAAGTDDRDGNTDASGAVVDGRTWPDAVSAGLAPEAALVACDSERPLRALGCLITGPGSSNLLDLHLLGIDAR